MRTVDPIVTLHPHPGGTRSPFPTSDRGLVHHGGIMTASTRRRIGAGLLILALAGLTLAGCSSNTGNNTSAAPGGAAPEFAQGGAGADQKAAADGVAGAPAAPPGAATAPSQQQQV